MGRMINGLSKACSHTTANCLPVEVSPSVIGRPEERLSPTGFFSFNNYFFHFLHGDPMLGDMLNIAAWVIFRIPGHNGIDHLCTRGTGTLESKGPSP